MASAEELDYYNYMSHMPNYLVPRTSSEAARRIRCQKDGDALAIALGLVTQVALDKGEATNRYYDFKDNPQRDNTEFRYYSDTDSDAPLSPPHSPPPVDRDLSRAGWMRSADPLMVKDPALYSMLGFEVYENWKAYILAKRPWPPVAPKIPSQRKKLVDEKRCKNRIQGRLRTPTSPRRVTRSQSTAGTIFYELTDDGKCSQHSGTVTQSRVKSKIISPIQSKQPSYRIQKKRR